MMDNVNIIIFPAEHARQAYPEQWKGRTTLATTRGRVVDHIAFAVDNLADALGRLRAGGVTVLEEPRLRIAGMRSAFIQGPDNVVVEIVEGQARKEPDPAAWGSNHAGRPIPQFVAGDECLFCHRNDIGPTWPKNSHQRTVREGKAPEEYVLGAGSHTRLLKQAGYGKFDIQTASGWDKNRFADRCAGCHATAVDASTKTFSAIGLECYTCHGDVTLNHTKDTSLIWLSKKRRGDPRAVTSICAQCHLRVAAKSRSTGLPYPNNFIAGDNLFQDYAVDLAQAGNAQLNPGDRHVYRGVRDVALKGSDTTCLSCHHVHANSTAKHRRVLWSEICEDCHYREGPKNNVKRYAVSSELCEY